LDFIKRLLVSQGPRRSVNANALVPTSSTPYTMVCAKEGATVGRIWSCPRALVLVLAIRRATGQGLGVHARLFGGTANPRRDQKPSHPTPYAIACVTVDLRRELKRELKNTQ
jgi:hypothetical protein